jgi:hypothetical protein
MRESIPDGGPNPTALTLSEERARRYDHLAHIPEGTAALATQDILQQLNNISCGGRCAVGSGGKSVGARSAPGGAACRRAGLRRMCQPGCLAA